MINTGGAHASQSDASTPHSPGRRELISIAIIVVLGIAATSLLIAARVQLQSLSNALQQYSARSLALSRSVNFLIVNRGETSKSVQNYMKVRIREGLDDLNAQRVAVDREIAEFHSPVMRWLAVMSDETVSFLGNADDTVELRLLAQKILNSTDDTLDPIFGRVDPALAATLKSGEYLDNVRERAAQAVKLSQETTQPLIALLLGIGAVVLIGIFAVWQRALKPVIDRLQDNDLESRAAQRVAKFGYWMYDAKGTFRASGGLADVLGMSEAEIPETLEQMASVGRQSGIGLNKINILAAYLALTENDGVREFTRILPSAGPDERVVRERVESRLDPATGARHMIGIMIDVSELAKAQSQAARADKLESIGLITGAIAHDVNNVLAVVQGNVELIELKSPSPETTPRIAAIKHAIASATSLVRHIGAMSIGVKIDKDVFEPASVADEAIRLFVSDCANTRRITVKIDDGLAGLVSANRSQYVNALLNLLINAKEATASRPDGEITFTMRRVENPAIADYGGGILVGSFVRIDIADNGDGMNDEVLRRAADPFFSTKLSKEAQPRGLGLWSAYMFARNANGYLSISSRERSGTCITMHLPMASSARPRAQTADLVPAPVRDRICASVLIVDDNADLLTVIDAQLKHRGYETATAGSISRALDILDQRPSPPVIVSDIKLANSETGFALARQILQRDPTKKFVFISGHYDSVVDDPLLKKIRLIRKPIDIGDLDAEIQRLIAEPPPEAVQIDDPRGVATPAL